MNEVVRAQDVRGLRIRTVIHDDEGVPSIGRGTCTDMAMFPGLVLDFKAEQGYAMPDMRFLTITSVTRSPFAIECEWEGEFSGWYEDAPAVTDEQVAALILGSSRIMEDTV